MQAVNVNAWKTLILAVHLCSWSLFPSSFKRWKARNVTVYIARIMRHALFARGWNERNESEEVCARGCCPRRCVDVWRESEKGAWERRARKREKARSPIRTLDQFRSERENRSNKRSSRRFFFQVLAVWCHVPHAFQLSFPEVCWNVHTKINEDRKINF